MITMMIVLVMVLESLTLFIVTVRCLKLLREHDMVGEEGASDEPMNTSTLPSEASHLGQRRRQLGGSTPKISVTRADIIFQKVITAEHRRREREKVRVLF